MAIVKHIKSKNANYTDAINYLFYQHDEKTKTLLLNEYGQPMLREEFYADGLNCTPETFDLDCSGTNRTFNKNRRPGEIKSHHYIISYDPRDASDCGLTGEKAQELSLEVAQKMFPGHQALVVTHTDGENHSGNIHTHIVINSVRANETEKEDYMTQASDYKAGGKHRSTNKFMEHFKKEVMAMCEREGLHQIDLLSPAPEKVTEAEFRAKSRGQEKMDKVNKKINVRDWSEILDNIKISIRSIMIYILIMIIGEIIINSNLIILDNNLYNLISISIIQLISSGYLLYIIKKFYIWEDIGFSKINKKNLIWFVPYIFILIPMIYTFIEGIYKNISSFDSITWISIFMILIGTITAGFSEEVMFRGMLLNDLKNKISLKNAMIISSLGFSILHITTIFSGKTLIEALANVIVSSLLGFSFAPLAIILNNILPLVIFHILWN